jgi:opacity protein-like surface antigen
LNGKAISLTAALTCLLGAATARPAAAQADISAGYQFTHTPEVNLPVGFYVDVSGTVAPAFAIVGEISGAYRSETVTSGATTVHATARLHTFMAGVRVASHGNPRLVPFGQMLVGGARLNSELSATTSGAMVVSGENAETDFTLQMGGGVDAMVRRNLGLRLGADYRRIFFPGFGENDFRLVAGLVLPFGK